MPGYFCFGQGMFGMNILREKSYQQRGGKMGKNWGNIEVEVKTECGT